MSAMWEWLRTLQDEAVTDWANKGLVRRAGKVLASQQPADWSLRPDRASARIEGFGQHLSGVGFGALHCECPAFGPCHHLCAFLLGLRARLQADAAPGDGAGQPRAAPPRPWLDGEDVAALVRQLGGAATRKALGWLVQGHLAGLTDGKQALVGTLSHPEAVTVRLPRAGGLAASTCTCKATACAHRALVVFQARQAAGRPLPPLPQTVLDDEALARLTQLENWLLALALQGWASVGPAFLDQGEALATELRQAGLVRPGAAQQALVQALRADLARRGGAGATLPARLAALWVLLRGLRQRPLPRPHAELAGVARRTYLPTTSAGGLDCAGVALWKRETGQRGFSVYLIERAVDGHPARVLRWSESRSRDQDPDWSPAAALRHATLGGVALPALLLRPHRLLAGWCSQDGRLSAREGTRLQPLDASGPAQWPACDPLAWRKALAARWHADPWQEAAPEFGWLAVSEDGPLTVDRALQRWQWTVRDLAGEDCMVHGGLEGFEGVAYAQLRWWLGRGARVQALFGDLSLVGGRLALRPVSVRWAGRAAICHLSVPWLRPPAQAADHEVDHP